MKVELRGVNFQNKGAELMMVAILQQLNKHVAISPILGAGPGNVKNSKLLGIKAKAVIRKKGIDFRFPEIFPINQVLENFGFEIESNIDVVLDASGFAYSDQWGNGPIVSAINFLKRWKTKNNKFILMPQAFGPFKSDETKKLVRELFSFVDLAFARDIISMKHVTEAIGSNAKLHLAPDFTNIVTAHLPSEYERFRDYVCLIPNYRMIDKLDSAKAEQYLKLNILFLKKCRENSIPAYILIHDTGRDLELANTLIEKSGVNLEIVKIDSALDIKSVLGIARLVIGTRFHGIVSALSQNVPVIATGWSHKYSMLMKDYDVADYLVEDMGRHDKIDDYFEIIKDGIIRRAVVDKIKNKSTILKCETYEMWKKVFNVIDA